MNDKMSYIETQDMHLRSSVSPCLSFGISLNKTSPPFHHSQLRAEAPDIMGRDSWSGGSAGFGFIQGEKGWKRGRCSMSGPCVCDQSSDLSL